MLLLIFYSCSNDHEEITSDLDEINLEQNTETKTTQAAPLPCDFETNFIGDLVNTPGTSFDYDMFFKWNLTNVTAPFCDGEPYKGVIEMRTENDFFCPPNPDQSNKDHYYSYTIPGNIMGTSDFVVIPHTTYQMKIFEYRLIITNEGCPDCVYTSEWYCVNIFD